MLGYFSQGKHGQEIRYTPEDFLFRWKKLERVLEKEGQDGLLLVTGLDGSEHLHTNYLINWLFLGLSGPTIFTNKYLDPIYSEMVVLVSPKQSFIFLTPQAKKDLEPLIYTIQNCTIFCPTDKEYAAKDILDIIKISFFYQSISKFNKVGLFLGPDQDTKIIQKWPIIQSYALEPVGKTFFTLKYQTANLHQRLFPLFRNLDKHSLKNLVATTADSLEGQIKGSTQLIQYTKADLRGEISQLKLQEPLFESADIVGQQKSQLIRVLFGKKTETKSQSSDETIEKSEAFHFTIEHGDPITKLQVWRTYFLNNCISSNEKIEMTKVQSEESFLVTCKYQIIKNPNPNFEERSWLISSYLGLVQGVIDGIATISKDYRNLNTQFIISHILNRLNQISHSCSHQFAKEDLEVYLQSYDAQGDLKPIDFKDSISFKLTTNFYVLKVRVNHIKYLGKSIGSICFSQSFILQEGCYLLLTKDTPYFDFWKTQKESLSLLQNLNPNVQFPQLGFCLSGDFRSRLFIPLQKLSSIHFNIPLLQVKYYFHEKGLRVYSDKAGWKILLYTDIQHASMINKIQGQWVLFKIKNCCFFQGIESNFLCLQFRGKAFDFLLKKINDKSNDLHLNFLDVIPPLLGDNWLFSKEVLKKDVKEGAFLFQHQILQNDFLWSFIQAKQLMVLNQMKDIKLTAFKSLFQQKIDRAIESAPKIDKKELVIITGTYGTSKYRLAQTLARFGSKQQCYKIFHIPYENVFAKMEINTFLEMLSEFIEQSSQTNAIFIVILPCWLNAAETIPALNQKYSIRTVVAVVSCGGFYSTKHGTLADNALTFAVPGFAQSIVLDSRGQSQPQISSVSKIVWSFNKQVRATRSSNSTLSTGQVTDILGSSLYNSEYHRFLRNKYGSLYRFDTLSNVEVGYIQFKYPICDLPALKSLSAKEGWLVDQNLLREELKHKRQEAEQSKDELMEMLYRLEQSIALLKRREKCPRIRCIKGVIQTQEGQLLQILWTGCEMKERQLANKSRNLGIFILANNYDEFQVKEFLFNLTTRKLIMKGLKTFRTKEDISEQQRTMISKEGKNKYLDGGQFYDGFFYRDIEGNILKQHPQIDKLITQWIDKQNKIIEQHNQSLKKQWETICKQIE